MDDLEEDQGEEGLGETGAAPAPRARNGFHEQAAVLFGRLAVAGAEVEPEPGTAQEGEAAAPRLAVPASLVDLLRLCLEICRRINGCVARQPRDRIRGRFFGPLLVDLVQARFFLRFGVLLKHFTCRKKVTPKMHSNLVHVGERLRFRLGVFLAPADTPGMFY